MSTQTPASDPDAAAARRSRLLGIKLRAVVADHHGGAEIAEPKLFAPGSALVHDGAAWILLDDRPANRLGAALAWALRNEVATVNVIAESSTGVLARRAAEFALPIAVWHLDERTLWPAVVEPLALPPEAPVHHRQFRQLIADAGADPGEEHGVILGEVAGLEVCRVVDDPAMGSTRLEVGVGAHDREAFTMLHGDVPTPEALQRIVAVVRSHRAVGASPHPLNRLGAERLLRSRVLDDPAAVGAARLVPAQPPVPRPNVKDPVPCVAVGESLDGSPLVVVCSVGIDLDLVPYAADARLAARAAEPGAGGDGWRLVIVTPSRDRLALSQEMAALLRQPADWSVLD